MWKICSKLFKTCLKDVTYDQIMFKVWRQCVQRLSKFCSKYIPKLLKICLKSIGNLFQISRSCPSSVQCITEIMQKNRPLSVKICQNISDCYIRAARRHWLRTGDGCHWLIVYLFTVLCDFARWSILDVVDSRMSVNVGHMYN